MDKDGLISDSVAKDFHPQFSSVCVCVSVSVCVLGLRSKSTKVDYDD